jgi:single-strand DNA-binding protein
MNALRNSVRLIGHLGDDPKIRKFDGEKSVANFSVATNENFRDHNGNKKSETTWHKLVAVEGKLTNHSYEDKNGETHFVTEIVVNDILVLDKKEAT